MPSEYRLKRRVQFYETDAAGIVHFSCFLRYMEEAEHAMWRAAGLSIAPPGAEIGWPRAEVAFKYFSPLRFEDEFEVHIKVAGKTSKTIQYTCDLEKNGAKIASGAMTIICVQKRPNMPVKAVEIPREIAERFEVVPSGATEA